MRQSLFLEIASSEAAAMEARLLWPRLERHPDFRPRSQPRNNPVPRPASPAWLSESGFACLSTSAPELIDSRPPKIEESKKLVCSNLYKVVISLYDENFLFDCPVLESRHLGCIINKLRLELATDAQTGSE